MPHMISGAAAMQPSTIEMGMCLGELWQACATPSLSEPDSCCVPDVFACAAGDCQGLG